MIPHVFTLSHWSADFGLDLSRRLSVRGEMTPPQGLPLWSIVGSHIRFREMWGPKLSFSTMRAQCDFHEPASRPATTEVILTLDVVE